MMAAMQQEYIKSLGELVAGFDADVASVAGVLVSGIELDSRLIAPGDLFIACPGYRVDGRDFVVQAIAAGAVAILVEQDELWSANREIKGVELIVVNGLTEKISEIAGRFYDHPSRHVTTIGVTGTNGKTSCTQLIMQLLNQVQQSCAVIGTLGAGIDGQLDAGINTTPDALSIQKFIATWQAGDADAVAMEVSSHGLVQGRVAALHFTLALFTNLSRDHLDYHGTMQAYAEAKAKLFQQPGLGVAVINNDDPFASALADVIAPEVKLVRYSSQRSEAASSGSSKASSDFWVDEINYHQGGINACLHSPWGEFVIDSPMLGVFNLSNLVGVIAALTSIGYPIAQLMAALPHLETVSGRMDRLQVDSDITVVVDYAHTPDALEHALLAMRQHTEGRLWCVFGCGGDRDQGKRPQMGAVVQRLADHVVVTSDNPRNEPANSIIDEILTGIELPTLVEEDRAKAIAFTIANAKPNDSVLIAGKGHEDYQQIGDERLPFSDINQARLALAERGK